MRQSYCYFRHKQYESKVWTQFPIGLNKKVFLNFISPLFSQEKNGEIFDL